MSDDEKFFAWLDGELTSDEASAMEARVAADPELAARAEQHRAMQERVRAAFDPIVRAPLPDRLRGALGGDKTGIVDFAAARQARSTRSGWKPLPQWSAMAATLAIGVFFGTMVPDRDPIEVSDGKVFAAAALGQALDTQLASAPGNGPVRVGMTFRAQSGAICRSFTDPQSSGLACRDGDRWQVRGLFAAPDGQSTPYRMAAGMDPGLAALVDSTMSGDPFDEAAEHSARARGWR